jgi:hypothetical protein
MPRKFDIGRHNEVLMNDEHYNIYKIFQHYLDHPYDLDIGPIGTGEDKEIGNSALWLDKYTDTSSADLKYYDNGQWNLLFANKFELLAHLLDPLEPSNPIEGMLWVNGNGVLCYYHNGQFQAIKAYLSSDDESSSYQYEDFLIINPMKPAEYAVVNNFTKFLFSNTPIKEWEFGVKYSYQQGVLVNNVLYVCNKEHWSTNELHPLINGYYWTRVDTLLQFLVPNSNYDKIFLNGLYLHEKVNELFDEIEASLYNEIAITFEYEDDNVLHDRLRFDIEGDAGFYDVGGLTLEGNPDGTTYNPVTQNQKIKEEEGYIKNTTTSVYIPIDDFEIDELNVEDNEYETDDENTKLVTGVHVNPTRLESIQKYFLEINKGTRIVPIPKENTEFYGVGTRYEYEFIYKTSPSEKKMYNHKLTDFEKNKIIAKRESDVNNGIINDNFLIQEINFYKEYKGMGKLLMENIEGHVYDYSGFVSNGTECIRVNKNVVDTYDYIYALHYNFSSSVKVSGKLERKRVNLNDQQSIYVGKVNPRQLLLFAQGLYYQQSENTYEYSYEDEYIYLKENLMTDDPNVRLEVSVIEFPNVYQGKITTSKYDSDKYIADRGYRVDINSILLEPEHCLGFISGVQTNLHEVFDYYDDDPTAIYFKDLTLEELDRLDGEFNWVIAETDVVKNDMIEYQMYRGKTKAITVNSGNGIQITRDINTATDDILYLDYLEIPIFFVDGVLVSQSDIKMGEDYIILRGLTVGQEVVMIADKNESLELEDILEKTEVLTTVQKHTPDDALEDFDNGKKIIEDIKNSNDLAEKITSYLYEDYKYYHSIYNFDQLLTNNPDCLLFQDNATYVTLQTDLHDAAVVYLRNGLICDTEAVETSSIPYIGYDGEIKHLINIYKDEWIKYNASIGAWIKLDENEIEKVSKNSNGFFSTGDRISIINEINGQKYCSYLAYKYSDTIEKPLLTGYCYPDGNSGTKDGLLPFTLKHKHYYHPGKNELSIYINGVRQTLTSPFDYEYKDSYQKECDTNKNNSFLYSIDDGSTNGQAINEYEGYYTYRYFENGKYKRLYKKNELTANELDSYDSIELISTPNKNIIFYVVEQTETGERSACERYVLTYKHALASKGAYANNTYQDKNINLSTGNLRVFINGIRQPFGTYEDKDGNSYCAYKIIDSNTIQIQSPLIGGGGNNMGDENDPKFPINPLDPNSSYYEIIDEILIEKRSDYSLREITIPIKPGKIEFSYKDGIPTDLFKTKDVVMIYINGLAYGNEYTIDNNRLTLDSIYLKDYINEDDFNVITFEWR